MIDKQYLIDMEIGDYVFGHDTSPCFLWVKVGENRIAPFTMSSERNNESKRDCSIAAGYYTHTRMTIDPPSQIYMEYLQESLDLCYKLYDIPLAPRTCKRVLKMVVV